MVRFEFLRLPATAQKSRFRDSTTGVRKAASVSCLGLRREFGDEVARGYVMSARSVVRKRTQEMADVPVRHETLKYPRVDLSEE
jgi:hypothetical protein